MFRGAIIVAVALLHAVDAVPRKPNEADRRTLSLADDAPSANASLVETCLEAPAFEVPGLPFPVLKGYNQQQWHLPEIFKRQTAAASCSNYCGPTQSAPRLYCYCGQQCCGSACCATASGHACCGGGLCCNTASGAVCCGTACCANGATCGNGQCAFKT